MIFLLGVRSSPRQAENMTQKYFPKICVIFFFLQQIGFLGGKGTSDSKINDQPDIGPKGQQRCKQRARGESARNGVRIRGISHTGWKINRANRRGRGMGPYDQRFPKLPELTRGRFRGFIAITQHHLSLSFGALGGVAAWGQLMDRKALSNSPRVSITGVASRERSRGQPVVVVIAPREREVNPGSTPKDARKGSSNPVPTGNSK